MKASQLLVFSSIHMRRYSYAGLHWHFMMHQLLSALIFQSKRPSTYGKFIDTDGIHL